MIMTAAVGALAGEALRRWRRLHSPSWRAKLVVLWVAMITGLAGAASGGLVGFVTWGATASCDSPSVVWPWRSPSCRRASSSSTLRSGWPRTARISRRRDRPPDRLVDRPSRGSRSRARRRCRRCSLPTPRPRSRPWCRWRFLSSSPRRDGAIIILQRRDLSLARSARGAHEGRCVARARAERGRDGRVEGAGSNGVDLGPALIDGRGRATPTIGRAGGPEVVLKGSDRRATAGVRRVCQTPSSVAHRRRERGSPPRPCPSPSASRCSYERALDWKWSSSAAQSHVAASAGALARRRRQWCRQWSRYRRRFDPTPAKLASARGVSMAASSALSAARSADPATSAVTVVASSATPDDARVLLGRGRG